MDMGSSGWCDASETFRGSRNESTERAHQRVISLLPTVGPQAREGRLPDSRRCHKARSSSLAIAGFLPVALLRAINGLVNPSLPRSHGLCTCTCCSIDGFRSTPRFPGCSPPTDICAYQIGIVRSSSQSYSFCDYRPESSPTWAFESPPATLSQIHRAVEQPQRTTRRRDRFLPNRIDFHVREATRLRYARSSYDAVSSIC